MPGCSSGYCRTRCGSLCRDTPCACWEGLTVTTETPDTALQLRQGSWQCSLSSHLTPGHQLVSPLIMVLVPDILVCSPCPDGWKCKVGFSRDLCNAESYPGDAAFSHSIQKDPLSQVWLCPPCSLDSHACSPVCVRST